MEEKFIVLHSSQYQKDRWRFSISCLYKGFSLTGLTHVWTVTQLPFTKNPTRRTFASSDNELRFGEAHFSLKLLPNTVLALQVTAADVKPLAY